MDTKSYRIVPPVRSGGYNLEVREIRDYVAETNDPAKLKCVISILLCAWERHHIESFLGHSTLDDARWPGFGEQHGAAGDVGSSDPRQTPEPRKRRTARERKVSGCNAKQSATVAKLAQIVQRSGAWERVSIQGLEDFDFWFGPHPHMNGRGALYVGPVAGVDDTGIFAASGDTAEEAFSLAAWSDLVGGGLAEIRGVLAELVANATEGFRVGPNGSGVSSEPRNLTL